MDFQLQFFGRGIKYLLQNQELLFRAIQKYHLVDLLFGFVTLGELFCNTLIREQL
jgi:hypothetical protein